MRIPRFLTLVGIVTLSCLVYVWQNVRQVELSYRILHKQKQITKLVDQNRILRYNVLQLKSPEAIENRLLASRIKLKYTTPVMIAQLSDKTKPALITYSQGPSFWEKTRKVLSGVFALRSQVEARP